MRVLGLQSWMLCYNQDASNILRINTHAISAFLSISCLFWSSFSTHHAFPIVAWMAVSLFHLGITLPGALRMRQRHLRRG